MKSHSSLLAAAVILLLSACSRTSESGQAPVEPNYLGPNLTSMKELVDAADAVVLGTVTDVQPGRQILDLQFRAVTLRVDEVLAGSVSSNVIIAEEEAWIHEPGTDPIETTPSHRDSPSSIGEVWIAALQYKPDGSKENGAETYTVLGRPGFFLIQGTDVETTSDISIGGGETVEGLSKDELVTEVKAAAEAVGKVA